MEEIKMRRILSLILACFIILVFLWNLPSNVLNEVRDFDNKNEYAAIPPVEAPTKPPRK
jgi:hypothetical protein